MICTKCGEAVSTSNRICRACGTWQSQEVQLEQEPVLYELDIRKYTSSAAFILGCLLITAGTIGGAISDLSWSSILGLAFASLYIIGLWILVFDGPTLTALSLFKVSAVVSMVWLCITFAITGFALLFSVMMGFAFLFLLAIVGGLGYVLVRYYFLALFKVLDSIRIRIETNRFIPLDGLGSFLLFSYVLIAISIINEILTLVESQRRYHTHTVSGTWGFQIDIYGNFSYVFEEATVIHDTIPAFSFPFEMFFAIASSIGIILCLRKLKHFDC